MGKNDAMASVAEIHGTYASRGILHEKHWQIVIDGTAFCATIHREVGLPNTPRNATRLDIVDGGHGHPFHLVNQLARITINIALVLWRDWHAEQCGRNIGQH